MGNINGQDAPNKPGNKRIKAGIFLALTTIIAMLVLILVIAVMVLTAKAPEESRKSRDREKEEEIEEREPYDEEESTDDGESTGSAEASEEASSPAASATEGSSQAPPPQSVPTETPTRQQFILPESNTRYLTMDDLEGLTKDECRIARNELFARHGRLFTDPELQAYFDSLDWYQGTIQPGDFNEAVFNAYEIANRDLIIKYEQEQGYR